VLDAIQIALDRASIDQSKLIRRGEKECTLTLDLGEIKVTRRINEKATGSRSRRRTARQFKSPQTMVDQFFGALSFDPHEFLRMDEKAQVAELRRIAEVDVDIDVLEGQIKTAFDGAHGRQPQREKRRAEAEGIVVPKDLPERAIDEKAILDRITAAGEQNTLLERRKSAPGASGARYYSETCRREVQTG
jgi:hypothetical protein